MTNEIENPADGAIFESCVREIERNIQAPLELVNGAAIAAIAAAMQGVIDVATPDGRVLPTSLYIIIRGKSGERKTAVCNRLFEAIGTFDKRELEDHSQQKGSFEHEDRVLDKKIRAVESKIAKLTVDGQPTEGLEDLLRKLYQARPAEPRCFTVMYDDVTPEALAHEMSKRSKYAALVSSEGAGLIGSSIFKSFSKLNSLWSGEAIKVDRKTSESSLVEGGRLSICLMVQPEIQDSFIAKDSGEQRASGLWARFLVIDPISLIGKRGSNMALSSWGSTEAFGKRLTTFLEKSKSIQSRGDSRHVMHLAPEAARRFIDLANRIECDTAPGGHFQGFPDLASKLAENVLRVAALLEAFHSGVKMPITLHAMETAIGICLSASSSFMKVFYKQTDFEKDCQDLWGWLAEISGRGRRYLRKTYVQKYGPGRLRRNDRLDACLFELQRLGYLSNILVENIKVIDLVPAALYIHDAAMLEVARDAKK